MYIETLQVGSLGTNCYLVGDEASKQAAVIDPGGEAGRILAAARQAELTISHIINTHGHGDHMAGNADLVAATDAALVVHANDADMLTDPRLNLSALMGMPLAGPAATRLVAEGDVIQVGGLALHVLHTPGHTPGGISLYAPTAGVLFCGDALFQGSIGRTDLPGGDHGQLLEAIRLKLLTLPDETVVYPGHGPASTIGDERRGNPWLA